MFQELFLLIASLQTKDLLTKMKMNKRKIYLFRFSRLDQKKITAESSHKPLGRE